MVAYPVIAFAWINKLGIPFEGMLVAPALPLKLLCRFHCRLTRIMEEIIINFLAPRSFHADGLVIFKHNIVPEHILAVAEPDVRMKRISDHDVVFDQPMKAFAVFEAAIQTKIVADFVAC